MPRKRGGRRGRKGTGRVRQKSLNHQLHTRMQSLNKIGESRHEAKQNLTGQNQRTEGIFSIGTYDNYKQVSVQFSTYLKENYDDVKNIDDINKSHIISYLQHRDLTLSANTISRDLGALNKLFNTNITKKEANLQQRSYKKITRSRTEKAHDKKYNPKNYEKEISLAKATGIRRESFVTGDYRLKEQSIYEYKNTIFVVVIEKGGKFRNVPIRDDMKDVIKADFNVIERDSMFDEQTYKDMYKNDKLGANLIENYTTKIDNHAFRREYAQKLYKEELAKLDNPQKDYYKEYDKRALYAVSKALGHNRLRVVVEHYLR